MASFNRVPGDSDDEVDLEALRLAALQTLGAKPKFVPHVNHSNLISIVPVNVVPPIVVNPVIKLEPISPTLERNIQVDSKFNFDKKDKQEGEKDEGDEKETSGSETDENDEDILHMDDKDEEDSFERLLDQLEAEIEGKVKGKSPKGKRKRKRVKKNAETEVELVEVKIGKKKDGPVINIRESASPPVAKERSRSRSLRRSRSPFRRSRTPLRRSRSPFWRSRTPRRSWSPRRSPFPRRSRSRSFRRSKSPRRRSVSPKRRSPFFRGSFSPRRRVSISPRRRSKSPFRRRSRSPVRRFRSPIRRRSRSPLPPRRRSMSLSPSPNPRRNRSPLRCVEKNTKEPEPKRAASKGQPRQRNGRRHSPRRTRRSPRKKSPSPKKKTPEKLPETPKEPSPPLDPVLEARKKKFERLEAVDPSVDKKISLKSVKETLEDDDEDALNLDIEPDLWDESEESDTERESRFKTTASANVRTVLSFRNLGVDTAKKINLRPLMEEGGRERRQQDNKWSEWRRERPRRNRPREKEVRKPERLPPAPAPAPGPGPAPGKPRVETKENEVSTTVAAEKEDDFDALMREFEKELETDSVAVEKPRISVKKDLFDDKTVDGVKTRPGATAASQPDKTLRNMENADHKAQESESNKYKDMPEDYPEDDDFVLNAGPIRKHSSESQKLTKRGMQSRANPSVSRKLTKRVADSREDPSEGQKLAKRGEDGREDLSSDLRAILSRKRTERLTKVTKRDIVPNRLVQSAFQGLGGREKRGAGGEKGEVTMPGEGVKRTGGEGRRVLLLQRDEDLPVAVTSIKVTIPEVKPDTTLNQRLMEERKWKRKIRRTAQEADDETDELALSAEEDKPRRFRLKRNVTLAPQVSGARTSISEPCRKLPNVPLAPNRFPLAAILPNLLIPLAFLFKRMTYLIRVLIYVFLRECPIFPSPHSRFVLKACS